MSPDRAGNLPRPKRRIPIRLSGSSEAAFHRAARIGDGFLVSGRTQIDAVQIKAKIEAKLAALGRDRDAFGFESIQQYSRGDSRCPGHRAAWRSCGAKYSVVAMLTPVGFLHALPELPHVVMAFRFPPARVVAAS